MRLSGQIGLERFRFSCSKSIAAVPYVVGALLGREETEGDGEETTDLVERARAGGAEKRLQFGEGLLNRIAQRSSWRRTSAGTLAVVVRPLGAVY